MVRQVTLVAVFSIVQGSLECLAGLFYAAMGPLMGGFMKMAADQEARHGATPSGMPPALASGMFAGVYLLLGLATLAVGVLRIVAGIRGLKYQGRTLGIISFAAGVIPLVTCYCAPTSLAVGIYGLIVYLSSDVARAFEMAKGGLSADQIKAAFP